MSFKRFLQISLAAAMGVAASAHATTISHTYFGTADDGNGSALVEFSDVGGNLVLRIDNTSTQALNNGAVNSDGTNWNASVITGVGANVTPNVGSLVGWSLFDGDGNDLTGSWSLSYDGSMGNIDLEFLALSDNGSQNGIYNDLNTLNPGWDDALSANAVPDVAVLTLDFADDYSLEKVDYSLLRMQNVGVNGNGSLKLDGQGGGTPPQEVPQPGMLALFGIGLLGLLVSRRRG